MLDGLEEEPSSGSSQSSSGSSASSLEDSEEEEELGGGRLTQLPSSALIQTNGQAYTWPNGQTGMGQSPSAAPFIQTGGLIRRKK